MGGARRLREYLGRSPDTVLAVLGLLLFLLAWPTVGLTHTVPASLWPIVAAAGVLPFLLVRASPFLGWAVWLAGGVTIPLFFPTLVPGGFPWQVTGFLVLLALTFAVAWSEDRREIALTWVGTTALFILHMPGAIASGWVFGLSAIMGVGLLVRRLTASRRELARQTEERDLERARRAVAEERTRIARDLHDVVAHRMSMVVVQAQSAQYRLGGVHPAVAAEFDSVAEQARGALNEVRSMLGVLRSDGQLAESVPQPGTAEVEQLLRDTQQAGLPLDWRVDGDPASCSDATAMTLYRIVQESLANASRHAAGSGVVVELDYGETVRLRVANGPARVPATAGTDTGQGIPGMAARAASVGGQLRAGPSDGGGFEVLAVLPARVAG